MDQPVIEVNELVKQFRGGVTAVNGLSMKVHRGQVLGLAGPNGSGKSVTMRTLLGLIRPTSGYVRILGTPVTYGASVLGKVGALVDGPGFVPHLSGLVNLRLAASTCGRKVSPADFEEAVEMAALGDRIDRPYRIYSHGMRYRLGLARALMGHPEVLLLDEAATGLDPIQASAVRKQVVEAAKDGVAVIYAAHQLYEVEQICTHVVVMSRGKQVMSGSIEDIRRSGKESKSLEDIYIELVGRSRVAGGYGVQVLD